MRSSLLLSATLATYASAASISLLADVGVNVDVPALADIKLDPTVNPTVNLTDLVNLEKINVLASPVDSSSTQYGTDDTVTHGSRLAKRDRDMLVNLKRALVDLSDLLDLSTINVLSAPVDTHAVQNGDGDTVTHGFKNKKARRSLLDLTASPDISPDVDLSDLVDASTINILASPVDSSTQQYGNGDTVTHGDKRRSLLGSIDLSPDVSPDVNLSDLLDLDTINILASPVDSSTVQYGNGDTVTHGDSEYKRTRALQAVKRALISLSDLADLSTINLLSAPVDTHSVQNGNDDTVTHGATTTA